MCVSFYNQHQQILFLLYIYIQERLTHHRHIQFEPFVTNLSKQFMFLFILVRDICIKSSSFYIIISLCCVGLTTNLMKKICKFRSFFVFFFLKWASIPRWILTYENTMKYWKKKKHVLNRQKLHVFDVGSGIWHNDAMNGQVKFENNDMRWDKWERWPTECSIPSTIETSDSGIHFWFCTFAEHNLLTLLAHSVIVDSSTLVHHHRKSCTQKKYKKTNGKFIIIINCRVIGLLNSS